MVAGTKKRIEITVETRHVSHIRNCLSDAALGEDFTVSPVISGWGPKGYWSSEGSDAFARIGSTVTIRFSADEEMVEPLLRSGFGILAMEMIPIYETQLAA